MSVVIVCHAEDCPRRKHRDFPMKPIDETYQHVIYECVTCGNVRAISKTHCGGTLGAGRREDVPATRYWAVGHARQGEGV
jgi:hypothetical protein